MSDKHQTRAALEDAIRADLARFPNAHGVLTDWLVIAVQENVTNGVYDSTVAVITPTDRFPIHRILGLLDHTTTSFRALIANQRPDNT